MGPTSPSAVIVPVPATCLPPLSLPGVILSMIPSANIMPADGPPTSCSRIDTLKGNS